MFALSELQFCTLDFLHFLSRKRRTGVVFKDKCIADVRCWWRWNGLCHEQHLPYTCFNRRSIAVQWAANRCRRIDSCSLFAMEINVSQAMRARQIRRYWSPSSCPAHHRLETEKDQNCCLSNPAPWQRTAPTALDSWPPQRCVWLAPYISSHV